MTGAAELFAAACAGELEIEAIGRLGLADIDEASGVVAGDAGSADAGGADASSTGDGGGRDGGLWWTHNDSGDEPRIFAVDDVGAHLATVDLDGAVERDWEDIALRPSTGDDRAVLYVGDTGDNAVMRNPGNGRGFVRIFRFDEPDLDLPADRPAGDEPLEVSVEVETITLEFPDGAHDVEALLVDPLDGDLVLVTKDWGFAGRSEIYSAPGDLPDGATATLEHRGTIELGAGTLITAADVTRDGGLVALRSYGGVHLFERPEGQPLWAAFEGERCDAPGAPETQGESLGFTPDGGAYVTVSEGEHATLHRTAPAA